MKTFKEFLLEFEGRKPIDAIADWESPPFFLNPKMIERVFNIPNQHAVHGLSINNLLTLLPQTFGRASQLSTFTHLDTDIGGNPFFDDTVTSIDPDNPIEAFVLVKGRVTGKFNMDIYSAMVKGGRRMLMMNIDTIEESQLDREHESALANFADEMRKFVGKKVGSMIDGEFNFKEAQEDEDYPFEIVYELDNKQKYDLIKSYMDYQEKLASSDKYKTAFMYLMVLQKDKRESGYNELILDKVKPLAIYVKPKFSTPDIEDRIKSIKEFGRLPIKLNVKEADIDRITKKMR